MLAECEELGIAEGYLFVAAAGLGGTAKEYASQKNQDGACTNNQCTGFVILNGIEKAASPAEELGEVLSSRDVELVDLDFSCSPTLHERGNLGVRSEGLLARESRQNPQLKWAKVFVVDRSNLKVVREDSCCLPCLRDWRGVDDEALRRFSR